MKVGYKLTIINKIWWDRYFKKIVSTMNDRHPHLINRCTSKKLVWLLEENMKNRMNDRHPHLIR